VYYLERVLFNKCDWIDKLMLCELNIKGTSHVTVYYLLIAVYAMVLFALYGSS